MAKAKTFVRDYTSADIVTENEGPYEGSHINVEHDLGELWPVVALWEPDGNGNPVLSTAHAIYYIDEDTVRIFVGSIPGTWHIRVVA